MRRTLMLSAIGIGLAISGTALASDDGDRRPGRNGDDSVASLRHAERARAEHAVRGDRDRHESRRHRDDDDNRDRRHAERRRGDHRS